MERRRIRVRGTVQGVGFRPFVYRLASRRQLHGLVRNDGTGVTIEAEGEPDALDAMIEEIRHRPPPLARIDDVEVRSASPRHDGEFVIRESSEDGTLGVLAPPDVAPCDECLGELHDPADRRHRYPFLNCTQCGPRFTIVRELPYDRARTTMAGFPMCRRCAREYEDPRDRRFHAQPTACPDCGPRLRWIADASSDGGTPRLEGEEALTAAVAALDGGRVVAVKGLGGFHLACDASDDDAVRRLRRRKGRPDKPLAVMVGDLDVARSLCRVDAAEAEQLRRPERPIVLLRRSDATRLAGAVAPGLGWVGIMLPYTPLHHLLLEGCGRPLVMTSGNRSSEPIRYRDRRALEDLDGMADHFLLHDRPIESRCDDSVVRVVGGERRLLRRSRGFAPRPIPVPEPFPSPTLAVGGHLKTTFCLGRDRHALLSHHIGDLDSPECREELRRGIGRYRELFDIDPEVVVHDLHPDYASTALAAELAGSAGIRGLAVQHHHAHVAGCAAENGVSSPFLGIAYDGTGYGPDGTVWGGELLLADLAHYRRVGRLRTVPLPGGAAAVRQPWRMAAVHLRELGRPLGDHPSLDSVDAERREVLEQMLERRLNAPETSSVGRLFDAVAGLVGLRREVTFEGQAAMELESCLAAEETGAYRFEVGKRDGMWEMDPRPVIEALLRDLEAGVEVSGISTRFHRALVQATVSAASRVREETGVDTVVLSGGVFQNAWLLREGRAALAEGGFRVMTHRRVPCNDGGLAYGQAVVAAARGRRDERDAGSRNRELSSTEEAFRGEATTETPEEMIEGESITETPEETIERDSIQRQSTAEEPTCV